METKTYNMIVMSKYKNQPHYKAMNIKDGGQVNNLVYASLIRSDKYDEMCKWLDDMARDNKNWQFKLVVAGKSKILYQTK